MPQSAFEKSLNKVDDDLLYARHVDGVCNIPKVLPWVVISADLMHVIPMRI